MLGLDKHLQNVFLASEVAIQWRFPGCGSPNESKMTPEFSKIRFWSQKIKISNSLNESFWNVFGLDKHLKNFFSEIEFSTFFKIVHFFVNFSIFVYDLPICSYMISVYFYMNIVCFHMFSIWLLYDFRTYSSFFAYMIHVYVTCDSFPSTVWPWWQ